MRVDVRRHGAISWKTVGWMFSSHFLLIGLTIDIRTRMPYAVNGSCGLMYLSGDSARSCAVEARTAMVSIAETNSLPVRIMIFLLLQISLIGTSRGVRRA